MDGEMGVYEDEMSAGRRSASGAPWLSSEILITELLKNEQHSEV
jgi:SH3-like domain-containing protein